MMNDSTFSTEREKLLKLLLEEEGYSLDYEQEIKPRDRNQCPPLTSAQRRFWFTYHRKISSDPDIKVSNNISLTLKITGSLLIDFLKKSLNEIIMRHEILRTNFEMVDKKPLQIVNPVSTIDLTLIDLSHLSEEGKDSEKKRLFNNEALRPFDLTEDILFRLNLFRINRDEHYFLVTIPHIIGDEWSFQILSREIALLYNAYSKGGQSPLPELPVQFADFACWEQERLNRSEYKARIDFWKNILAGASFYLPTDYPRPETNTPSEALYFYKPIPDEIIILINSLSRESRLTKFTILFASLNILLSKWSGKKDIIIPIFKANRDKLGTEQLFGCLFNILPVRTKISDNQTLLEFIQQLKKRVEEVSDYQDTPYKDISQSRYPGINILQTPFYHTSFNFIAGSSSSLVFGPDLKAEVISSPFKSRRNSPYDMIITAFDSGARIEFAFSYKTDLFKRETVEKLADSFCMILEELCRYPFKKISEIDIADELKPC